MSGSIFQDLKASGLKEDTAYAISTALDTQRYVPRENLLTAINAMEMSQVKNRADTERLIIAYKEEALKTIASNKEETLKSIAEHQVETQKLVASVRSKLNSVNCQIWLACALIILVILL